MDSSKKTKFYTGLVITGFILILTLWGIIHTPYDPYAMDSSAKFAHVSFKHLFGCDQFGRDVFSRVLIGIRETMFIAASVVFIGAFLGTVIGMITGYFGGWLDEVLMRLNDAMLAFPSILLALVIIGIFGPGKYQLILALGIAFIPSFARVVRGEVLKIRNLDYILSVKLYGASDLRILVVHILPNLKTVLLSTVIIGFNNAVLAEAGMSYLGIGVQPPEPSLGRMLSEAQAHIYVSPMNAIFPGIIIVLMILGFSLLGDTVGKRS